MVYEFNWIKYNEYTEYVEYEFTIWMFTYANKKLPVIIVVSVPFFSLLSLLLDVVKRVSSGLLLWALLFRIFTIFTYVT